jgi:ABC-type uncharacterized transport system permease subunit
MSCGVCCNPLRLDHLRPIGETMTVLMATGNTPIMDWSMFNGANVGAG